MITVNGWWAGWIGGGGARDVGDEYSVNGGELGRLLSKLFLTLS